MSTLRTDTLQTTDSSFTIDVEDIVSLSNQFNAVTKNVANITNLRSLDKTRVTEATTAGYYTAGDGGNSTYRLDPTDTTSVDNGGTVIVGFDGGRWKLVLSPVSSIKQFGAKVDGVTNDTGAWIAALASMPAAGGRVYCPSGTSMVSPGAGLLVPANVEVSGEFTGSVVKASASCTAVFVLNGGSSSICNIGVDGNGYLAVAGIVNDSKDFTNVSRCYVTGCGNGYTSKDNGLVIQSPIIKDCLFSNNTTNVYIEGGAINIVIANNFLYNGTGLVLDQVINHVEGARVMYNTILPSVLNTALGIGIIINGGLENQFSNNIIDQCPLNAVVVSGTASKSTVYTKFTDNWFGHSIAPIAGGIGVKVQGQVNNLSFRGNTFSGSPTYGLTFATLSGISPTNVIVDGNMYLNNTTGDVQNNSVNGFYKIINNLFTNASNNYSEFGSVGSYIDGNNFNAPPVNLATATKVGPNNQGLVTRNKGTAVIAATTSSVVVTHGLNYQPNVQDISLTTAGVSTVNLGITATSASTFTVSSSSAPVSSLSFGWSVQVKS